MSADETRKPRRKFGRVFFMPIKKYSVCALKQMSEGLSIKIITRSFFSCKNHYYVLLFAHANKNTRPGEAFA